MTMTATAPTAIEPITSGIYRPDLDPVTGIWDDQEAGFFHRFRVTLRFTNIVMGGVPRDPEIMEAWLRQRITGGDEEIKRQMMDYLDKMGIDGAEGMTFDELKTAAKALAAERKGNTFLCDENGFFLMPYQPKALLKEVVSMLYPYSEKANRMGPTSKAARAFWAERVFVEDHRCHLYKTGLDGGRVGVHEPDGTHLQIGHISGAQGPRSTLTYYDYVTQPHMTFVARVMATVIPPEMWRNVLMGGQFQGMGALRSMEPYGRFRITGFEELS